jgi:hypothetical protein
MPFGAWWLGGQGMAWHGTEEGVQMSLASVSTYLFLFFHHFSCVPCVLLVVDLTSGQTLPFLLCVSHFFC